MAEAFGVFSALGFLAAFVASILLMMVSKKVAARFRLVAHPRNDRFHKKIVPLGGGIGIFLTILLACLGIIAVFKLLAINNMTKLCGRDFQGYIEGFLHNIRHLWVIIGCLTVLFLLGLWDDIKNLKPLPKLIVQFAVAFAAAYWGDVRVELFIESRFITSILSSFWVVLVINIFNFLDNMDGASAGIAIIISLVLFVIATFSGQVFVSGFTMIFAGTLAGFLIFNFHPASIFMGDAGSFVIGFLVAMFTLRTTYHQAEINHGYAILAPLVIMAIPLYDFISVTFLRIKQRKSPFIGDTQHFSHRLKKLGLTEFQTVLTLYLATIATGLGAVALTRAVWPYGFLIFLQTIMILEIIVLLESAGKNSGK
ncbi:MAG: hypothetical protein CVV39_01525 [Planctomycetes bacterium HGW-Planctomycetes-1]|nr:MAG: hypothetical protein CVV39_01525 [Planctomycetes bacterium HGW-Planctomycetes-1]